MHSCNILENEAAFVENFVISAPMKDPQSNQVPESMWSELCKDFSPSAFFPHIPQTNIRP